MTGAAIRIGVIGVGMMGERHARLYAESTAAQLVGVYDRDQLRAKDVAARWKTRAFSTVGALLAEVEAVSVASSTATHAALGTLVLEQGRHLLIEKPLAESLVGARRLAERAVDRPELVVQVGHVERFNPVVHALRALLRGRRILALSLQRLSPYEGRSLDSDVIHDLMIHDLDLAAAFCGDQLTVHDARGGKEVTDSIDFGTAHLRAAGGTEIVIRASRVAARKVRAISVTTEDLCVEADLLSNALTVTPRTTSPDEPHPHPRTQRLPQAEPLKLEVESFLRCVACGARPEADIMAGLAALERAAAISNLIAQRLRPPTHRPGLAVPAAGNIWASRAIGGE